MKRSSWMKPIFFGCAVTVFTACSENENDGPVGQGDVAFEVTDAPIDDASVRGVVVTVADVRVDGKSISGFSKQSIDLKSFQDGNTKVLGDARLDAKSYSNLTLVLDLDEDEQGNSPGCYVLDQSNTKYKLKSTASGSLDLVLNQSWSAAKDAQTNVVMDFDLRKSIRYSDDPSIRYQFVSDNNLNTAIRLVTKQSTGTIKGTYESESAVDSEKIIVYAYKKGTFNASTETEAQGTDGIQFKNAVASAEVKSGLSGSFYTLAYLPEDDYELYFAAYSKNATTGRMSFDALLQSETTINGSVMGAIPVEANATVNISTSIKGVI